MKPTIKELWHEYQLDKPNESCEKKKEIRRKLSKLSEELVLLFNDEQNKKFEEYHDALSDLFSIEEYEAFEKGVVFTARFLSEAAK